MMRIGIDLRWLHQALALRTDDDCIGGIGAYSKALVKYLLEMDIVNYYVLFGSKAYPLEHLARHFKTSDRLKIVLLPRSPGIKIAPATLGRTINYIYQQIVVGSEVRKQNLDIMHFQEQGAVILNGPFKKIVSVMDMTSAVFIDRFFKRRLAKSIWRRHIRNLIKADKIIAISESTKHDTITWAGVPIQKITVIPLGVPEHLSSVLLNNEEDNTIRRKLGIRGQYFLYVGGLQFSKNIPGLIEAFAAISRPRESIDLVVAGETRFWRAEQQALNKQIEAKGLSRRVKLTGWVTTRQLASLYRGAAALVHPSFYEGFGLTPLEAMSYGCPVIASNASSLPEVIGDAGLLRDPRKPEEFTRAMEQMLSDGKLRTSLVLAGKKRAASFSWGKTAGKTLEVYRELQGQENNAK